MGIDQAWSIIETRATWLLALQWCRYKRWQLSRLQGKVWDDNFQNILPSLVLNFRQGGYFLGEWDEEMGRHLRSAQCISIYRCSISLREMGTKLFICRSCYGSIWRMPSYGSTERGSRKNNLWGYPRGIRGIRRQVNSIRYLEYFLGEATMGLSLV